jgi:hypothetical protein
VGFCAAGSVLPAAGLRVLLVAAENTNSYIDEVQSRLQATGAFAAVDVFYAESSSPALSTLQAYAAVLAWSHSGHSGNICGDVLADYWDGGGAVVVAVYSTTEYSSGALLQGRLGSAGNGYILIDPTGLESSSDSLGTVLEQQSPLMAGVASLSASSAFRSTGAVINGGVVVARWASGRPLVVRGTRSGRPLVTLNMYPPSSNAGSSWWTGDGAALMRNALLYSVNSAAASCAPCGTGTFAAAGAHRPLVGSGSWAGGGVDFSSQRRVELHRQRRAISLQPPPPSPAA